jgi:Fe-S-cluster containining protein
MNFDSLIKINSYLKGMEDNFSIHSSIFTQTLICNKCEQCCKGWTKDWFEFETIPKGIKRFLISRSFPYKGVYYKVKTYFKDYRNDKCDFLKEGSCTIYNNRPITCKVFPLKFNRKTLLTPNQKYFQSRNLGCTFDQKPTNLTQVLKSLTSLKILIKGEY